MSGRVEAPLRVLVVDDEAPARARLRELLGDVAQAQPCTLVGMAGNGIEALRLIEDSPADVVLADIRMPAMDGVELARHLARLPQPPAVVFTTAYDEYAVQAFEVAAVDYLLKPVRAARLAEALGKARRFVRPPDDAVLAALAPAARQHFSVSERGRILLVPVADVLYLKAELKYVTARCAAREYVLDEALVQLEEEFAGRFLRVHRSCLVAVAAIKGIERVSEGDGEGHWEILLEAVPERLPISRRQWPAVKQVLKL